MPTRGENTQYFDEAQLLLGSTEIETDDANIIKDKNGILHLFAASLGSDTIEVQQRLPGGAWETVDTIAQKTQDGITLTGYSGTMPVSSNYEYRVKVAAMGPHVTYGIQFEGS